MAVTSAYSTADGKEHLKAPSHVQTQSLDRGYRPAPSSTPAGRQTIGRVQASHGQTITDPALNGPRPLQAKDYRSVILLVLLSFFFSSCTEPKTQLSIFFSLVFQCSAVSGASGVFRTSCSSSPSSSHSFRSDCL